jgi:hypothetical protein
LIVVSFLNFINIVISLYIFNSPFGLITPVNSRLGHTDSPGVDRQTDLCLHPSVTDRQCRSLYYQTIYSRIRHRLQHYKIKYFLDTLVFTLIALLLPFRKPYQYIRFILLGKVNLQQVKSSSLVFRRRRSTSTSFVRIYLYG